jgi:hypothetical protein
MLTSSRLTLLTPLACCFSEIKSEYLKDESSNAIEAPLMLKLIQASRPNVFNSSVYNQKFGKFYPFLPSFMTIIYCTTALPPSLPPKFKIAYEKKLAVLSFRACCQIAQCVFRCLFICF